MNDKTVALVTGANRGLGFEISRQLGQRGMTVIMGARDSGKGEDAAEILHIEGLDTRAVALEVTDSASIASTVEMIIRIRKAGRAGQ